MDDVSRALFELFEGLPRGGPGSDEHTREALRRLPPLPKRPRVLDLGCGPGSQTLVLAHELGVPIEAVDVHRPYLEALERDAQEQGLAELVRTRLADMGALEIEPKSVDLIWSEGAIFILGFEEGLQRWYPHLRSPGGLVVVSEATWFVESPPEEVRDYWARCYPGIQTEADNLAAAARAGYEPLDHFRLPPDLWWTSYYTPLQARIEQLRAQAEDDSEMATVIAETEQEMELYRRHGGTFGYTYYLLRSL